MIIDKAKNLLKEKIDLGRIEKTILSNDTKFIIPNLADQASMLEWAGVNFGDDNIFLL